MFLKIENGRPVYIKANVRKYVCDHDSNLREATVPLCNFCWVEVDTVNLPLTAYLRSRESVQTLSPSSISLF